MALDNEKELRLRMKENLNKIIPKADGMYSLYGFYKAGTDISDEPYMQRRKARKLNPPMANEDRRINVQGIHFGYVKAKIPFFNSNIWSKRDFSIKNLPALKAIKLANQADFKIDNEKRRKLADQRQTTTADLPPKQQKKKRAHH